MNRAATRLLIAGLAACLLGGASARAQGFDWKRHQGETIDFLTENHPWSNAVVAQLPAFEKLTGIKVQVDTFQEQQMRQRLVTVLQSKSTSVDAFMSLKSLEGQLYAHAGWYADLGALMHAPGETAPDYDVADFSHALVAGETFDGKLDGIPLNIEGPIVYYRKDVFQKCGIQPPASLDALKAAAAAVKQCEPTMIPWATRGLKPALPYTFSNVLHNFGTDYMDAAGKPDLCAPAGVAAIAWYADMLRQYGPPGAVNNSFLQTRELYGQGRAAMAFEIEQRVRRDDEVPTSPGRYRRDAAAAGTRGRVEADGDRLGPVDFGVFHQGAGHLVFRAMGDVEGHGCEVGVAGDCAAARVGRGQRGL